MTGQERVKQALLHQEPDRVPLDIGGSRVTGIHVDAYRVFRDAYKLPPVEPGILVRYLQLAEIDQDFRSLLRVDLESVNPDSLAEDGAVQKIPGGSHYRDRWNCGWYMPEGGAYFDLRESPLAGPEALEITEIDKFQLPNPSSEIMFRDFSQATDEISRVRNRAVILSRDCPGIYETAAFLRGHEKFMLDLALNTASAEALMDRVLEYKLDYWREAIKRIQAAGLDYFIITESEDLGSQSGLLISPSMYRKLIKPRHTILFRAIKDFSGGKAFIELHSCGAIRELIPDFIESGVEILNPVQVSAAGMNTAELKKEFGGSLVFHGGGIDSQHTLPYGSAQEVRDEVKRRIEDLAPGGGFIFTPVHSIQKGVPAENFLAMMETFYACADY